MNWITFCSWWGGLNVISGFVLHNLALVLFGFGMFLGGLCVAIQWEKETGEAEE